MVKLFLCILISTVGLQGLGADPSSQTLLSSSVMDLVPAETRRPVALWSAIVGGGLGVGLATWGLGSALAHLNSSSGVPLGATVTGLSLSTVFLCFSGVAIDYWFNGPPDQVPTPPRSDGSSKN